MAVPSKTEYAEQNYILNENVGEYDLNILDAWKDYTGKGIKIAFYDDGFDYNHVDLKDNYDTSLDYDYKDGDNDAIAEVNSDKENHGTNVMGVAGAAENGTGIVGVSFDSTLVGYKKKSGKLDDAIKKAVKNDVDIINISQGRSESFRGSNNAKDEVQAMSDAAENGRDGLGAIIVKAAGNSRRGQDNQDTNSEMTEVTPYSIVVAGVNYDGGVASGSSYGAAVTVSGFYKAYTTDPTGDGIGKVDGEDYLNTSGTSFSTPMVAGVVALMLEANDQLGWRDVQTILSYSARHVGSEIGHKATGNEKGIYDIGGGDYASWGWNGAKNWNGGGLHFSNDYGFGLVDATAAVRLAETWNLQSTSKNIKEVDIHPLINNPLSLNNSTSQTPTATTSENILVEYVTVEIDFTQWDDKNDLILYLISPAGTRSQLFKGSATEAAGPDNWVFGSNAFRGENSHGEWKVELRDADNTSSITVENITIKIQGSDNVTDNLFIFTNEFSEYHGISNNVNEFNGTASGVDTINAAAVTSNTTLDLNKGSGEIDGITVSTSNIDIVYTGDGNDVVTGGIDDEQIDTGRGNDRLQGGGGNDRLFGGGGDDIAIFDGNYLDYSFYYADDASILIRDCRDGSPDGIDCLNGIEKLQFADETVSVNDLFLNYKPKPPFLDRWFDDQVIETGTTINLQYPKAMFEGDGEGNLSLEATLANGAALPDWLRFNPDTSMFSGTPPHDFNETLSIKVTAYDPFGQSVGHQFNLEFNSNPQVMGPLVDQSIDEDQSGWSYTIDDGTFSDADIDDVLTFKAALADGDPLPGWISFDADTLTFSGTPPKDYHGSDEIVVTASDGTEEVTTEFTLTVNAVNDRPEVNASLVDQSIDEDQSGWSYTIDDDTFSDADIDDVLTFKAALADGDPLPDWISFDADTLTFSGTPPKDYHGSDEIVVTASDGHSDVTTEFTL
ncbi:MAG: S8 family serine peptidase, partial [Hyphomicrobiales bacterium]|nr:S8 family serine peptidase [Hyphomicrobiales bacterium]